MIGATDLLSALDSIKGDLTIVVNEQWNQGIASSLAGAVTLAGAHGHDVVVIGLGDQPLVEPSAWRAVAAATGKPIAVATYGGQRRNPVRLDRSVWPRLR